MNTQRQVDGQVKLAVVGAGQMGRHHLRVSADLAGTVLVGAVDGSEEARTRAARLHRVPVYERIDQLLEAERPDALIIALPTTAHHEAAMRALAAGIHVLVEKPIAVTVEQGEQMVAAAEEAGLVLAVGHIERFNSAIEELARRVRSGDELGSIHQIYARRLGPFPPRIQDVGVIVDLATHDLNIMEYVVGQPVERVFAETARRIHVTHEDMVSGLLRFANGTVGVLDINWLTPTKVRELWVHGERGLFVVDYVRQDLTWYENATSHDASEVLRTGVAEGRMIRFPVRRVEPLRAELEHFVRAVRGEERVRVSGEEGLRALALAQALVLSGQEHRPVVVGRT